jgi:hypothetical protein
MILLHDQIHSSQLDIIIKWNTHCMKICAVFINCSFLFLVCVSENFLTVCCLWLVKLIFCLSSESVLCIFFFWLLKLSSLTVPFLHEILHCDGFTNCDNSCHSHLNYFNMLYVFNATCFSLCTVSHHQGWWNTEEKLCHLHNVIYIVIVVCSLNATMFWFMYNKPSSGWQNT